MSEEFASRLLQRPDEAFEKFQKPTNLHIRDLNYIEFVNSLKFAR